MEEQRSSFWAKTARMPAFPRLEENLVCDVCVVGGGIAGLTTAYRLAREGASVALLEDGALGSGESGRTSAHLSAVLDERYAKLARRHGRRDARLAAASHSSAIAFIEQAARAEGIDCGFERVDGFLFAAQRKDAPRLRRELRAASAAGLELEWAPRAPFALFDTGPCLRFSGQAQFHPLRYLAGLAAAASRRGARIFADTHVAGLRGGRDGAAITRRGYRVRARHYVVATNVPVNDRFVMHTKQAAYRTYLLAAELPRGAVPHGLYWDTADPYHYLRVAGGAPESAGAELLLVGGEDHKTGQGGRFEERYAALEAWARVRFPELGRVRERWSGQVVQSSDGLGYAGRNPWDQDNVYIVTGDTGNGLTHGTLAAEVITDLIRGRENPWARLYDPSRKALRWPWRYIRENANVVPRYLQWLVSRRLAPEPIPPGTGRVLQDGLRKIAAYRDPEGRLHAFSAACPHLGCAVTWNGSETTWDCPCHGSRFSATGEVLNGPARSGLSRLEDSQARRLDAAGAAAAPR
jgi:glycine/D-amino acid oxidase-like deaminating enzyme/nitrite reductase/ring-hydroxylating ferredoxin subunit